MFISEGANTLCHFAAQIVNLVGIDLSFLLLCIYIGVCQRLGMCYLLQLELLILYVHHGNNSLSACVCLYIW